MAVVLMRGAGGAGHDGGATWIDCDPGAPALTVTDLGASRGDGIFETIGMHLGRLHHVDEHLERLVRSATALDLPTPDVEGIRAGVTQASATLIERCGDVPATALVRVTVTRGDAAAPGGGVCEYIHADVFPDPTTERHNGVAAITLNRGYARGVGLHAPWLLIGAKSLSYAVNMAALREAARRGAQEAIFVTSDDYVLEAPRSSVVALIDGVMVTPAVDAGLLPGTGQQAAFAVMSARGYKCIYQDIPRAILAQAQAVWLTDSAYLLRPVHTLDGKRVPLLKQLTAQLIEDMLALPNELAR